MENTNEEEIKINVILSFVANWYGCSVGNILSKQRAKKVTEARYLAMYIIRRSLGLSFPRIGKIFIRHHATVIEGIKKVEHVVAKGRAAGLAL